MNVGFMEHKMTLKAGTYVSRAHCENCKCFFQNFELEYEVNAIGVGTVGEKSWVDYRKPLCPKCKQLITFQLVDKNKVYDNNTNRVDALMQDNERWSWSMGVNVEDIPKAMQKYPGSTYNPHTGQLLVRNRQHKLQEMKRRGMVEF